MADKSVFLRGIKQGLGLHSHPLRHVVVLDHPCDSAAANCNASEVKPARLTGVRFSPCQAGPAAWFGSLSRLRT